MGNIKNFEDQLTPKLLIIGRLQLLRKIVTKQIYFASKIESVQYQSCLITLNDSVLHNIEEIKQNATAAMQDGIDEGTDTNTTKAQAQNIAQRVEAQSKVAGYMKDMLTNLCTAVETVGFLNPMKKVY